MALSSADLFADHGLHPHQGDKSCITATVQLAHAIQARYACLFCCQLHFAESILCPGKSWQLRMLSEPLCQLLHSSRPNVGPIGSIRQVDASPILQYQYQIVDQDIDIMPIQLACGTGTLNHCCPEDSTPAATDGRAGTGDCPWPGPTQSAPQTAREGRDAWIRDNPFGCDAACLPASQVNCVSR